MNKNQIKTLHTINPVTVVKLTQHWSVGSRPRGAVIHRGCRTWGRRRRTCLTPGPWPVGCTRPRRGWWRGAAVRGSGRRTLGERRRCCQTLESSVRWCYWRSRCPRSELNSTRKQLLQFIICIWFIIVKLAQCKCFFLNINHFWRRTNSHQVPVLVLEIDRHNFRSVVVRRDTWWESGEYWLVQS